MGQLKDYLLTVTPSTKAMLTPKTAGNFAESREEIDEIASRMQHILHYHLGFTGELVDDWLEHMIVMEAHKHTGEAVFLEENSTQLATKDAVIFKGRGMAVFFPADCGAIVFRDGDNDLTGFIHASRISLGKRVISEFSKLWSQFGGNRDKTRILILPCICADCFCFEREAFYQEIVPSFQFSLQEYFVENGGQVYLNLKMIIASLIKRQEFKRIKDVGKCTACANSPYYSARRDDRREKEKLFRGAAFVIS